MNQDHDGFLCCTPGARLPCLLLSVPWLNLPLVQLSAVQLAVYTGMSRCSEPYTSVVGGRQPGGKLRMTAAATCQPPVGMACPGKRLLRYTNV